MPASLAKRRAATRITISSDDALTLACQLQQHIDQCRKTYPEMYRGETNPQWRDYARKYLAEQEAIFARLVKRLGAESFLTLREPPVVWPAD